MGAQAFTTGFALSFGLILAIGAQNAFVLRQGLMRQHVLAVVLFCALSDALLIALGVGGVALFVADFAQKYEAYLFGFAALWLFGYGLLRLIDAWRGGQNLSVVEGSPSKLYATLLVAAGLTFLNPHVYLDTVLLIGTISLQFNGNSKMLFGLGAALASFTFFFALGFGARFLSALMRSDKAWRILDLLIALIMFAIAISMLKAGAYF